jgi:hypothetical protein
LIDGVQPGCTQAVHRHTCNLHRQACQQGSHTRHITIVFTGLIRAAKVNLIDERGVKFVAFDNLFYNESRQIVGPDGSEHSSQSTDRRTKRVNDDSIGHLVLQLFGNLILPPATMVILHR